MYEVMVSYSYLLFKQNNFLNLQVNLTYVYNISSVP